MFWCRYNIPIEGYMTRGKSDWDYVNMFIYYCQPTCIHDGISKSYALFNDFQKNMPLNVPTGCEKIHLWGPPCPFDNFWTPQWCPNLPGR